MIGCRHLHTLGCFPLSPLSPSLWGGHDAGAVSVGWVGGDYVPARPSLGDACVASSSSSKAIVYDRPADCLPALALFLLLFGFPPLGCERAANRLCRGGGCVAVLTTPVQACASQQSLLRAPLDYLTAKLGWACVRACVSVCGVHVWPLCGSASERACIIGCNDPLSRGCVPCTRCLCAHAALETPLITAVAFRRMNACRVACSQAGWSGGHVRRRPQRAAAAKLHGGHE